jgi:flagellar assembly protein FliH
MSDTAAARPWRAPDVGPSAAAAESRAQLVTAVRIAEIEEQARDEGYRRGLEEGRRDGALEMHVAAEALRGLLASIEPQAALLDDVLVTELADLVIAVARQLVRRELKREPGEIVRVVREALAALPVSDAAIRVLVHPEDAALLRRALRPDSFERPMRFIDDVAMTRGGARVETDVSSVDASVEARLNAIAARVFGDEREMEISKETVPAAETTAFADRAADNETSTVCETTAIGEATAIDEATAIGETAP